jgi:hypothetical protein
LRAILFLLLSLSVVSALGGCSGNRAPEPEEAYSAPDVRADYEVFAVRCSKCHSLARPLNSGITDDDYWKAYVDKMRRQPGSGISVDDAVVILRFLHVYSMDLRKRRASGAIASPETTSDPDASAPQGTPR